MKTFRNNILLVLITSILLPLSFAMYGGQPGAFLSFGTSARSIGMGRAFVALADDSSASNINPAGMIQVPNIEGSFFQTDLYGQYQLTNFNLVYPMVDNHIGISYTQLASSPMELRDEYNVKQGNFTDEKAAIGISYAQAFFLPNLSMGTSVKYVTRKLHTNEDSRILGDLGFLYRPFSFMSVGATIQNILDFKLDNNSADNFKPLLRAGIAYKGKGFKLAYDIENDLNNWFLGMEYTIHPLLTVRGGINYESTNFGLSSEFYGIRLDYAYSCPNDGVLDATNRFSINMGIGQMISEFQENSSSDWYNYGVEKYQEGFFLLALVDMKKAFILNPHDKEVISKLTKLKKLEQLSSKLNLDVKVEKAIWPKYKQIKTMINDGQLTKARTETMQMLKRFPKSLNLMNLIEHINKKTSEGIR